MLVRERMSRRVVGVDPRDSIEQARGLMARNGFRHLPVLRAGRLIGIISDRDLRGAPATVGCVQDIMTLNPISTSPDASVDEAARVMETRKISALPVLEKNRVVGILTTTGILRAFVDLSGVAEPTTRIILSVQNGRAAEAKVRRLAHECHVELRWIHREGRRLHLRVKARNTDDLVTALEAAGLDVVAIVTSEKAADRTHTLQSP